MIINKTGAVFKYEDTVYIIGEPVVGTNTSVYQGLFGIITEIRDGTDKETENDTPDIYCRFYPPVLASDRNQTEKFFSDLYGELKKIEDIALDCVIMAPEMILPLAANKIQLTIFLLEEDWAVDNECGHDILLFTDFIDAKKELCERLSEELENGCILLWKGRDDFIVDETDLSYKCYLDNEYLTSHYSISIQYNKLKISDSVFDNIRKNNTEKGFPNCFIPEPYNPYPLCIGKVKKECDNCCLYKDMKLEGGNE